MITSRKLLENNNNKELNELENKNIQGKDLKEKDIICNCQSDVEYCSDDKCELDGLNINSPSSPSMKCNLCDFLILVKNYDSHCMSKRHKINVSNATSKDIESLPAFKMLKTYIVMIVVMKISS
jgi:hypothetical protein